MSTQEFQRGDGRRHVTDPTATRFNARSRYYQRGGPGARRPARDRNGTGGIDSSSIRVSVGSGMPGPRTFSYDNNGTRTNRNREGRLRTNFDRRPISNSDGTQWWRISIPQAGSLGKDRVMSAIKAYFNRHFQPYHVKTQFAPRRNLFHRFVFDVFSISLILIRILEFSSSTVKKKLICCDGQIEKSNFQTTDLCVEIRRKSDVELSIVDFRFSWVLWWAVFRHQRRSSIKICGNIFE